MTWVGRIFRAVPQARGHGPGGTHIPRRRNLFTLVRLGADRFDTVQDLNQKALEALRELAASNDKELPRIELMGLDETEP